MIDRVEDVRRGEERSAVRWPARAFTRWLVPLGAVMRKETRIFFRYRSWVVGLGLWPVLFPLSYLLVGRALAGPHGEGMLAFSQTAGTTNYTGFIVIGTTAWMWLNITLWMLGLSLRQEQMRGTLESNWLAPTPRLLVLLGTSATQVLTATVFLLVSLLEVTLLLRVRFSGSASTALALTALSMPWVYGLGMAFAALVLRFKEPTALVYVVRGLFLVFSGMTFPLAVLPQWMRLVAGWLPLTHTIEGLRQALLAGASFAVVRPQLVFLTWSGMALLLAGYVSFRAVDRHVARAGAVGHF